jgi:DNA-binding HxlR family transcriptional regulator
MAKRLPRADIFNGSCPSRDVLELIGGKWSVLVLCALRLGPQRTLSLKRRIDGISQKMLTQTLREMERHGLIQRIDYREVPPRVEYRLTRLGQSLSVLMDQVEAWIVEHYPRMRQLVDSFEVRA